MGSQVSKEEMCLFPGRKLPFDLVGLVAKFAVERDDDFIFPFWYSCRRLYYTPWLKRIGGAKLTLDRLKIVFLPVPTSWSFSRKESVVHVYLNDELLIVGPPDATLSRGMRIFVQGIRLLLIVPPCRAECVYSSCGYCSYILSPDDSRRIPFSNLRVVCNYHYGGGVLGLGKKFVTYHVLLNN